MFVKNEYEILKSLSHPYIPQVFSLENTEDIINLKLKYFEGKTMKELLSDRFLHGNF